MCPGQVERTPEHHLLTLTHVSRDMTIKALVKDACPALIIWEAQGTLQNRGTKYYYCCYRVTHLQQYLLKQCQYG